MTEQLDYQDESAAWHIICACGHTVSGPKPGTLISLCPNCRFVMRFKAVPIVYPERLAPTHREAP